MVPLVKSGVLAAPRPLRTGVDVCPYCHMTILDARYSAQVITSTGRVFFYDDPGCLLDQLAGHGGPQITAREVYVADFASSERNRAAFVAAERALFLFHERIRTPMGSGLLAFSAAAGAAAYLRERPQFADGQQLRWQQLLERGRKQPWVPGFGR